MVNTKFLSAASLVVAALLAPLVAAHGNQGLRTVDFVRGGAIDNSELMAPSDTARLLQPEADDCDQDLPEPDCDNDLPEPDCDDNLPEPGDNTAGDADCDEDLPEPDCDNDLPEPDCDKDLPEPSDGEVGGDADVPTSNIGFGTIDTKGGESSPGKVSAQQWA